MTDAKDFTDQVAVITGGGRGIGAAIAKRLAELGTETVVCGRSRGPIEATAQEIISLGGRCLAVTADVSDCTPWKPSRNGSRARLEGWTSW